MLMYVSTDLAGAILEMRIKRGKEKVEEEKLFFFYVNVYRVYACAIHVYMPVCSFNCAR